MHATVTLHVFSGRPNPTWVLSDAQGQELLSRIDRISRSSNQKLVGPGGGLGYQGFSVNYDTESRSAFVHAGAVDTGATAPTLVSDDREIESWLLATGKAAIPSKAKLHVNEVLKLSPVEALKGVAGRVVVARCPACHAVDAPAYNPGMWNVPAVQPNNNCYNYANNKITNTFAQPGRAHGRPAKVMQCRNVQAAAMADGLVPVANFSGNLAAKQGWYVALVIWPNVDYHWYRQDKVGCWSHKPGQTAARNTDNAGLPIRDPQTCNRGPYVNFCTYMITKAGVVIN